MIKIKTFYLYYNVIYIKTDLFIELDLVCSMSLEA